MKSSLENQKGRICLLCDACIDTDNDNNSNRRRLVQKVMSKLEDYDLMKEEEFERNPSQDQSVATMLNGADPGSDERSNIPVQGRSEMDYLGIVHNGKRADQEKLALLVSFCEGTQRI